MKQRGEIFFFFFGNCRELRVESSSSTLPARLKPTPCAIFFFFFKNRIWFCRMIKVYRSRLLSCAQLRITTSIFISLKGNLVKHFPCDRLLMTLAQRILILQVKANNITKRCLSTKGNTEQLWQLFLPSWMV